MKIYWIRAQAPRRVLALVKYLGIKADLIEMDLMAGALSKPEYAALNPNRKAPTLVDGELILWESTAIMAHLCIQADSDMWPSKNPAEQVQILKWLSWNSCHWDECVAAFYFEYVVKSTFGLGPPDAEPMKAKTPDFLKYAKVLDENLKENSYVACGRLTIADFQMASMASYWRESHMPMEHFPNIIRWLDTLMKIPAWAHPWPDEAN